ncbi:helix-turn-helix domain-containing protein [Hymenobacter metallicola]|uniref:DNA-binding protein n=1 Tax=Hymenobacter metallicola TaxID=2563114 RepID=A0A4Z0Q1X7_9BACT|nr:helix-turn-helix domain-containing protein [Hymenobacter metallicola]TGE23499.1 DNA-binding protein [Hymenobacter metallicola]
MELVINNTGVGLSLTSPQEKYILGLAAAAQASEEAKFKILSRRYTLSDERTEGLDYDDRLHERLGCCKNTAYALLRANAIRHQRMGKKIVVSESAVFRYLDPAGYAHLVGAQDAAA